MKYYKKKIIKSKTITLDKLLGIKPQEKPVAVISVKALDLPIFEL